MRISSFDQTDEHQLAHWERRERKVDIPGLVATSRSSATARTLQASILWTGLGSRRKIVVYLPENLVETAACAPTSCLGATKDVEQTPER